MKLTIYIDPVTWEQVQPDEGTYTWHAPFGRVKALEIEHDVLWYNGGQLGWKIRLAVHKWWQKAPEHAWGALYADWTEYGWPVPRKAHTSAQITEALKQSYLTPMKASLEREVSALRNLSQFYKPTAAQPRPQPPRWGWWLA